MKCSPHEKNAHQKSSSEEHQMELGKYIFYEIIYMYVAVN